MKRFVVLALLLSGGVAPLVRAADAAPATHHVQAGAVNPKNPLAPYEYTAFYPSEIRIHAGDTVEWNVAFQKSTDLAFHTVTFLGNNSVDRPHYARTDELPGTMAFNEATWERSETCGEGTEATCVLANVGKRLSSGVLTLRVVPPPTFRVRFDLPVGRYRYVCAIHSPMVGVVNVVPPRVAVRDRSKADIAREIARDTAAADALARKYSTPRVSTVNGQRVWTVTMEPRVANKHVSILGYFPGDLRVRAGDRVRWVTQGGEIHTVAFPDESNQPPGVSFFPRCDPDDPASGAPGVPYPGLDCPFGVPEVWMGPGLTETVRAPDDAVVTEATVHSSGIVAEVGGAAFSSTRADGSRWPVEFDATFPVAGSFGYACQVHGELPMVASVTVE
ncbi:MAG: hypothetical protein ABR520_06110 [Mycobacteriales bacterium]|nr:hypothetical protein [Frankia sp.]